MTKHFHGRGIRTKRPTVGWYADTSVTPKSSAPARMRAPPILFSKRPLYGPVSITATRLIQQPGASGKGNAVASDRFRPTLRCAGAQQQAPGSTARAKRARGPGGLSVVVEIRRIYFKHIGPDDRWTGLSQALPLPSSAGDDAGQRQTVIAEHTRGQDAFHGAW